jgi:hypothetical protein
MKIIGFLAPFIAAATAQTALAKAFPTSDVATLVSWCREASDNPQMRPLKLRIACSRTTRYWRASPGSGPGETRVAGRVETEASILMDPTPLGIRLGTDTPATIAACRVEEWERRSERVDVEVSCRDLAETYAAPALIAGACEAAIDGYEAADPSALGDGRATGAALDRCGD